MTRTCLTMMAFVMLMAAGLWAQAPSSPLTSTPTTRPDFGIWDKNSVQPPPTIEPVKLPPLTMQPGDGETEAVYRAALAWFDEALKHVDELVPAAEVVAQRLIDGGNLYAEGSPGYVQEVYGRAGGFAFLTEWNGEPLKVNDCLLVGQLFGREEGRRGVAMSAIARGNYKLLRRDGLVVHIASHNWPSVKAILPEVKPDQWGKKLYLLDTRAPEGGSWKDVAIGQMATCAINWAFHGEVFAAGTRKGKTLAMYASDEEPNGLEFDKIVGTDKFNDRYPVPAIAPGRIARDYLLTCQRYVAAHLEAKQARQVRLAASRMVQTMERGNLVLTVIVGHVHVAGSVIPRTFPKWVMFGREWEWTGQVLGKGDMLLYVGYLNYPAQEVELARKAGADAVTLSVDDGPTDEHRTHICGYWGRWDSTVNIKDFPVRILPASGVTQTLEWYALAAEMEKVSAKK